MKRFMPIVYLVLLTVLAVTGCASSAKKITSQATDKAYAPVIDPANFVTGIDNPFYPLRPGTTFIYEGKTEKGNEHNELTVTADTKVILGVTCVVVADKVMVDGKLEEATLDWYAQDKQSNVWYFGEDSKSYDEKGNVISTQGSWEAGVKGAMPGIIMEGAPKTGDTYRQEYYKGQAEDMASVVSLSDSAAVRYGSYKDMLMTKEWSALEPTVIENKYYAKGVGFVLMTVPVGSQRLELVDVRR